MNNTQLEYFVETVRAGSYSKAAKRLYVSPQAIAQSIKRLESELGISLMNKRGREISPTLLALELFPYAEKLVAGFSDFAARATIGREKNSPQQIMRLGITEAPLRGCLFYKTTLEVRANKKGMSLQLHFLSNEACKDGLREGLLDAAVIQGQLEGSKEIGSAHFLSVPLCVFSGSSAARSELDPSDLHGARIAVPADTHTCFSYIRRLLTAFNIHASFDLIENSEHALRDYLRKGGLVFGYGVTPMDRWDDVGRYSLKAGGKGRLNFYISYHCRTSGLERVEAFLRGGLARFS